MSGLTRLLPATVLGRARLAAVVVVCLSLLGVTMHVGVLPQLGLMCVLLVCVHVSLQRRAQAVARDAVLARTGSHLLGLTDFTQVRAIGALAAAELADLTPGVVAHGLLPAPDGRRAVPEDVLDAFRVIGHQLALAEASCVTHAELDHRAHHDQLTTLPTRALLVRHLQEAMDADLAAGTTTVALLHIDLDDFKQVNDVYGHQVGDELLVEVANRLTASAGPNAMAARFGGDEFAVLLTGLSDQADAERIAETVCHRIQEPLHLPAATVGVSASIGVAVSGARLTAGDLLRCADIAMYSAKARGKNRVERFTTDQHGEIAHHRMLEEHLVTALEREEIVLQYQPYVDLRTGRPLGVEALACWQHPTLGLLQPDAFLPLAERTGQSTMLGTHVLRTACRQVARWGIGVGVNVSARQVLEESFAAVVASALADAGLPPERLTLEIVESEQLDDPVARTQLQRIAATGVRIALDDFGTGYVSFGALRSFPIAQIKIDPAFLAGTAPADETLQLVISVGRVLGAQPIVQGVSSAAQAASLPDGSGGQGSFVTPPLAPDDVPAWLAVRSRC